MCDEHTRESIGRQLGRSITADDVVDVLDQAKAERGAPECIRMDNGPELIASAIRDWCRLPGTGTLYIESGSPWENPFVESFNARASRRALQPRDLPLVRGLQQLPTPQLARLLGASDVRRPAPRKTAYGGAADAVIYRKWVIAAITRKSDALRSPRTPGTKAPRLLPLVSWRKLSAISRARFLTLRRPSCCLSSSSVRTFVGTTTTY